MYVKCFFLMGICKLMEENLEIIDHEDVPQRYL